MREEGIFVWEQVNSDCFAFPSNTEGTKTFSTDQLFASFRSESILRDR